MANTLLSGLFLLFIVTGTKHRVSSSFPEYLSITCDQHFLNNNTRWVCSLSSQTSTCINFKVSTDKLHSIKNDTFIVKFNINFHFPNYIHNGNQLDVILCTAQSNSFKKEMKWKLMQNEFTVDANKSVIYNVMYSEPTCGPNKVYRENKLGNYRFNPADGSVFVKVPDCLQVYPFYDVIEGVSLAISLVPLLFGIFLETVVSLSAFDRRPFICHMISFSMNYCVVLIRVVTKKPAGFMCYVISLIANYSFHTAVTWMTVIVFDMWRHLHPTRILNHVSTRSNKKFAFQSLFAWGFPAFYLCLYYPLKYLDNKASNENCLYLFRNNKVQSMLFYGTPEIIQAANFIMVGIILWNIRHFDDTSLLNSEVNDKKMWQMCVRLLIVVGICNLVGVPSWACMTYNSIDQYFSLVLNVVQNSQGLLLFLAYYTNADPWKKLYAKIKVILVC